MCRKKRAFAERVDANVEALRINLAQSYSTRIYTYHCCWCDAFHLTSHPGGQVIKRWTKRVEKARRKALVREAAS